jgi:hypothetical protein
MSSNRMLNEPGSQALKLGTTKASAGLPERLSAKGKNPHGDMVVRG